MVTEKSVKPPAPKMKKKTKGEHGTKKLFQQNKGDPLFALTPAGKGKCCGRKMNVIYYLQLRLRKC